jgi:uncharacterized protein YwgA
MEARTFVQLALLALGGKIGGRTKLQKSVYFLSLMTGCEEDLGFRAHYYGPYSDDVSEAIGWLRTIGAVDVSSASAGMSDKSGFEIKRYDYYLNLKGRAFVSKTAERMPEVWARIQRAAVAFNQAGEMDYTALSVAAKTYFLVETHKGEASRADLRRLARRFGWDVNDEQIQEASDFLEKLDLIRSHA